MNGNRFLHRFLIMLDLTLDTSTDPHFIFLSEEKKILAFEFLKDRHNLSAELVPNIQKILFRIEKKPSDISKIFVGTGPGSYTGVRVGVSVATALSIALNVPLYPFCSLLAFIPQELREGSFTFLAGCSQGNTFLLHGSLENGIISPFTTHELIAKKDLSPRLNPNSRLITLDGKYFTDLPLLDGSLNLDRLLYYLTESAKLPPKPVSVHYLHTI